MISATPANQTETPLWCEWPEGEPLWCATETKEYLYDSQKYFRLTQFSDSLPNQARFKDLHSAIKRVFAGEESRVNSALVAGNPLSLVVGALLFPFSLVGCANSNVPDIESKSDKDFTVSTQFFVWDYDEFDEKGWKPVCVEREEGLCELDRAPGAVVGLCGDDYEIEIATRYSIYRTDTCRSSSCLQGRWEKKDPQGENVPGDIDAATCDSVDRIGFLAIDRTVYEWDSGKETWVQADLSIGGPFPPLPGQPTALGTTVGGDPRYAAVENILYYYEIDEGWRNYPSAPGQMVGIFEVLSQPHIAVAGGRFYVFGGSTGEWIPGQYDRYSEAPGLIQAATRFAAQDFFIAIE